MKEHILQQFIGLQIEQVTYFELNRKVHPFFYEGFENFDLGIEIGFTDDSYFYIGWKNNDCPQINMGRYTVEKYHEGPLKIDATDKWSENLSSEIRDIQLVYVSEEWRIPAKCTFSFSNDTSVSIVIAGELNLDDSLPLPLTYMDCSEFYVFHGTELPEIKLVRINLPDEYKEYVGEINNTEESNWETDYTANVKNNGKMSWQVTIIILILLWVVFLIAVYAHLN